jgi:hypothetical protein
LCRWGAFMTEILSMADHGHDRRRPTSPFLCSTNSLILLAADECVCFIPNN